MALFQEERLTGHYHDLRWLLDEYHRVVTRVIPVTVRGGRGLVCLCCVVVLCVDAHTRACFGYDNYNYPSHTPPPQPTPKQQAVALRPHFKDLELRLRPGLTTLTWTSMNIDGYVAQARAALGRLDALVGAVNDVVENRVEKALKVRGSVLVCMYVCSVG